MKHLNKQYRIVIASFLTAIYIISLTVAIFHYHHLEFSNNEIVIVTENKASDHLQVIFDGNYDCIIQHNLVNLQTSLLWVLNDPQIIHTEHIYYKNFNCDFYSNQILISDNPLRAPPSFS